MLRFFTGQDTIAEFYTPEKCYITELSNTPDDPDVSIAQARVEPGVTTCWHRLKGVVERYYILKGKGMMEVGNLPPQEVGVGDLAHALLVDNNNFPFPIFYR